MLFLYALAFAEIGGTTQQPGTWISLACVFFTGFFGYLGSRNTGRIKALEEANVKCGQELTATKAELEARDEKDRRELEKRIVALEQKAS